MFVITSYSIHYTKLYENTSLTTVIGGRPRQVRVALDPQALAARGLAVENLRQALAGANLELPAGARNNFV